MKIESIKKCGNGIEVLVNGSNHYFNINDMTYQNAKQKIKEKIESVDSFDNVKFKELKKLEGSDI